MLIQYKNTKTIRRVRDRIGQNLIDRRIAIAVAEPRQPDAALPDVATGQYARTDMQAVETPDEVSPITGKPKRRYNRRDLQAEK